jgi:hypothetical protein
MSEEYVPVLDLGEFLGIGATDDGVTIEGYLIDGACRYFRVDNKEEVKDS